MVKVLFMINHPPSGAKAESKKSYIMKIHSFHDDVKLSMKDFTIFFS